MPTTPDIRAQAMEALYADAIEAGTDLESPEYLNKMRSIQGLPPLIDTSDRQGTEATLRRVFSRLGHSGEALDRMVAMNLAAIVDD